MVDKASFPHKITVEMINVFQRVLTSSPITSDNAVQGKSLGLRVTTT